MNSLKRFFALTAPAVLLAGSAMAFDAKKGQEVFENSACMGCHNTDTDEKRGNAPALKGLYKKEGMTEAKVIDKIKKGGNGMPPYEEQLEKADFDNLLAYLKTL
ncbi:MAG: c-type cytochrome [Acidobacteriota bacterium]|jgi:mono/diheme cytochrome c family protein|nr:cytochrome c [Bryobacteraceae bacterium CoA2 C42]MCA2965670.1 cytochrome c [Acidobacteriaceae bacterium]MCA2968176.1 cytochrome c [Acidobacteriaceae bacterium]MCX6589141.1 cytochrome c [Acidobacteriota bacterium]